jgi:hypothetical protein
MKIKLWRVTSAAVLCLGLAQAERAAAAEDESAPARGVQNGTSASAKTRGAAPAQASPTVRPGEARMSLAPSGPDRAAPNGGSNVLIGCVPIPLSDLELCCVVIGPIAGCTVI